MPSLLDLAKNLTSASQGALRRTPPLVDKADPKPEVFPQDIAKPLPPPSVDQRRIVDHVKSCYEASRQYRQAKTWLWEQCRRFDKGEQWYVIDAARGVVDSRKEQEDMERCVTFNHVTRLVTKMVAMATQSEPEAYPVPVSDTPLDREACAVAEAIAADVYRNLGINNLRSTQARHAIVSSSSYRYWRWNKDKEALIPQYDALGQFVRAVKAPVGGLDVEVLSSDFVYWDPAARSKADATWCLIVRYKPIVALQTAYGDVAYSVQPDTTLASDGGGMPSPGDGARAGLSGMLGRAQRRARPNAALTIEYLEKPNPKHPRGAYAVVAGDTLLYKSDWPWADKENWPLAEMAYLPDDESPYAQGCVEHLIEAQCIINEELSRIKARLDKDKRVIYVQRLSEIGADAFEELRDLIKIYYNPGSAPPTPSNLPPISSDHFTMLTMALDYMEKFSGIVDVLNGNVPPGVTAGVAIDMMVREASTQFKPFINSLEQCEVDFMRGVISEYADKAPLELMIGMDRKGNPRGSAQDRQPTAQAMSLQALSDGGMVDIYLVPGSGLPRSEAGKKSERTANYQAGLYGQPGSPEALKLYWKLTDESDSHEVLAALEEQDQMQSVMEQMQTQIEQLTQALEEAKSATLSQRTPEDEANLAEHKHGLAMEAAAAADARKAQMAAEADERKTKTAVALSMLSSHNNSQKVALPPSSPRL